MEGSNHGNGKRWFTVTLDVLLPEQKEHTLLRGMIHASSEGQASRIAIKQALSSRQIDTIFSARSA